MSDGAQIALYAMMLILPLSALLARRVPLGQTVKLALVWIGIFALAALLVAQRDRVAPLWQSFVGGDNSVTGRTTRIAKDADGHFRVDATIDGVRRRMLIDSGASTTALSAATARAAGLDLDESPFPRLIETANGTVTAQTATVRRLTIGEISARDLPVVVSEQFGDTDVIGMNFLSRLASWRVERDALILEPRQ